MSPWRQEHSTAQHYRGLLNNRPSLTWKDVLDSALADTPPGVSSVLANRALTSAADPVEQPARRPGLAVA